MLLPGFAATLDAGPAGARPVGPAGRPSREASATRSSHSGALRALGVAVLAAGVLLTGLLGPAPASAQAPVSVQDPESTQAPGMLVSNHHLAADDTEDLATDRVWAQPFTTGASPTGYVLANVKLLVDASNASPNPRVQVYTFDGQEPGSLVATLNNPATIVADAVNVFTAPAGTVLDPSTIYFIVGGYGSDRSKRFVIRTVAGGSEDPASASGWRIDINSLFKGRYSGTSWKRSDKSAYLWVEGAERIAATDATLRGLALSAGTLDPAFAAGTTSYTATVAHHVERVTVMPAANDEATATIAYLDERGDPLADADGAADGFQVDLEVGDTTIAVEVTAEDRVTTRTYTLTVTRGEALSVMLEANPARLWEGAGPTEVTVTATLDGAWPTDTDITLAVAGSGEANVVGFAAVEDIVVTVPAFARVATATFTLTPDDDLTDERDETVMVSGTVAGAPGLSITPARLVLSDEEAASKLVLLSLSRTELSEDGGAAAVTVTATLDGDARSEDTAVAATVSGSGEPGVVGFAPVAPFTFTIPAGRTSAAAVIPVAPEDDYIDETDETLTVAGTAVLTVAPAALTLVDDDATSTKLHWRVSPLEIPEGAGPTEVTVTVTLDAAARTVDTDIAGAVKPDSRDDILNPGSQISSFFTYDFALPAGATAATGVFTLTPVQDDVVEDRNSSRNRVFVSLVADGLIDIPEANLPIHAGLLTTGASVVLSLIDDDSLGPKVRFLNCRGSTVHVSFDRVESVPVTGFELSDLVVENGTVTALTGSGAEYQATVGVADEFEGERTITVPFGAAVDADGQVNNPASCTAFFDKRPPRVAITGPADGGPVHGPFAVRIVFDEAVQGMELADLLVGNGTASGLRAVEASRGERAGTYAEYVATITPAGSGEVTVDLAAGAVRDAKSVSRLNDNLAAAQFSIEMVAPEVVLSLSRSELSEDGGATTVTVTATLDGDARFEDTAVAVTVSGSGEAGVVGFAPVAPFTLTVPAGHTSGAAVITVAPEDDYTDETDETVTVAGTTALTVAPAALTLVDDDETSTELHWTVSPLEIPEGAGPTEVTVTVTLDAAARTVDTDIAGAVNPDSRDDISNPGSQISSSFFTYDFALPAGATSATGVFTLTPVQDDVVEDRNSSRNRVFVSLVADGLIDIPEANLPIHAGLLTTGASVVLSLIDDDSLGPKVRFLNCRGSTVHVSFDRWGSVSVPVTGFELSDLVVENGTVTALTGSGAEYQATVGVADEFEGERTITVPFGAAVDADGQVNNPASCTAFFDKRPPRVAITGPVDGGPVHGPFVVRVVFDEPVIGFELADLTVGNGTASEVRPVEASRGEGLYSEYVATVTPAGSGEVTVDVAAGAARDVKNNDNLAAEQYGIEMVVPEVVLSLSHSALSEGSGATGVTVTATVAGGALVEDLPVTVAVSGSGDSGVVGFAAVPDFTLTIPARQTEATATFTVIPADDGTAAADETVTVRGTASFPWIAVEPATLSLLDNDEASTALLLAVTPATIAEGAGATEVTVTATLDGAARIVETEVTVTLSGPDTAGVEFAAVEPVILTIAAGAASGSATFSLTPTDDAWDRPDTAVSLTAAATNEVAIGVEEGTTEQTSLASGRATVLLADDDEASTRVSLSLSVTELAEAAAATEVTVTARLSGAPREEATELALSVAGVTAEAADFAAVPDFILTFPAGATSAEGTFTLAPVADALDEADETLAVRGVAAGLAAPPATIAILDDDDPPALAVAGAAAAEGAGELAFTATLDAPSGREVTVSFATADGTALAPADYLAARGTLTFAPGVTERTLAVTLVDDDLHEESEDLTVTLSDPAHATLAQALAEGRIVDDDPMPRIRLTVAVPAGGVVTEGGGAAVVTLIGRLEGAARSAPTVASLSVTGGTASAADFAAVPAFTLTIPPGATAAAAAFTLTPVDDTVVESAETLTVGSRTAEVVVVPATVTIVDDDDVTAPALSGATVEGALLALTYDETLDGASVPAPGAFTVRVARPAPEPVSPTDLLDAEGRMVAVVAVAVEGRRVTLTLASAVTSGDRVTVGYTPPPAGPATGPIRDGAGNGAGGLSGYPVDSGTPPVVRAVALVSTPTGGAYGVGEKIRAQVTFGEAVVVTGRPRLALDVGGTRRNALYVAGESSGARLVFAYEVASGESDPDGVGIVADSLDTKGGAGIADGESNPAVLRHAGLAAQVSHQVDGVAAELEGAVVRGATLVLTWNEALDASATPPAAAAFVVAAGNETRPVAASLVAGRTLTLTLDRAVRHGEVVTIGYTPPAEDPLRDAAGTPAAALAAAAVANETSAATDAKLGTLALSDVTLAPDVAAEVLRYSAEVEHTVRVTTVTAQANDHPFAAVTVGGEDADPDAPGHQVALVVGENSVAVTVTAQDGKTARTYTVTVTRAAPPVAAAFGAAEYSVAEGDGVALEVRLDADPERTVEIPLTVTPAHEDLAGVPASVTFAAGETARTFTVTVNDDEVDEEEQTVTFGFGPLPDRVSATDPSSAALVVTDDDHTPVVTTASPLEAEENRTAVATLEAADGDGDAADLTWRITGGADAAHFELSEAGELRFGQAKDYEAPDDADADGAYQVTVAVSDGVNEGEAALEVVLRDGDEVAPALESAAVDGAVLVLKWNEGLDEASVPAPDAFKVQVVAAGGEPAELSVNAVEVGVASVTLALAKPVTAADTVTVSYRPPETGAIRDLAGNPAAALAGRAVANHTPWRLAIGAATAREDAGTIAFPVTLNIASTAELKVDWTVADGTATSADYATPSGVLTIGAGTTSATIEVEVTDDTLAEADETFEVRLAAPPASARVTLGTAAATGTIEDDDELSAAVSVAAEVAEGAVASFTVTLTGATSSADVVVGYEVGGTATPGTDYTAPDAPLELTIPAGEASGTIPIATLTDPLLDPGETLTVTLSGAGTAAGNVAVSAAAAEATATVTITDVGMAQAAPTGRPAILGTAEVGEPLTASVADIVDPNGLANATFRYQWLRGDDAGAAGTEIAGATSSTYTPVEADQGKHLRVRVTFTDDRGTEEVLTSASTAAPVPMLFTATWQDVPSSHDGTKVFRVRVLFSEPAKVGYRRLRNESFKVVGGTVTKAIRVADANGVKRDDLREIRIRPTTQRYVRVTLAGGRACGTSGAICTEDERALWSTLRLTVPGPASTGLPTISIAPSTAPKTEGSAAGFVLSRTGDVSMPLTVVVAASESGAMLDGEAPAEVLFEAGQASVALTVATADDEAEEPASAVTVEVVDAEGAGYLVATDAGSATVTVDDDDAPVSVSIAASASTSTEGSAAAFVLTRTGDDSMPLTVTVAASESGAMLDGETPTEVLFAAGQASAALTLATADDEAEEAASAVTVTLVAGAGYVVAADAGSATVTVDDDDTPVPVSIAASAASPTEGTPAGFVFTRTGNTDALLTVTVAASESGAMLDGESPTEVRFAAGRSRVALTLATVDDEAAEAASAVTVTLVAGTGYVVAADAGSATVTVSDDDAAPVVVTAATLSVAENATAVATLEATDEDTPAESLAWSIAGGADAGAFSVTGAGDLSFRAAKDYESPDDADGDGSYEVTVRVTDGANPVDAALVVSLADVAEVSPVSVSIAAASSSVTEGQDAVFTLSRTGDAQDSLAVTVSVSAVGAVLEGAAPAAVTFAAESSTATLRVATADDATAEADGRIGASVAAGPGYAAAAGVARVDVLDNDRSGATPTVLWSAEMTVVDDKNGSIGAASAELFSNEGGSAGLDGQGLWYDTSQRKLHLSFTTGIPEAEDLTLHVDGVAFALPKDSGGSSSVTFEKVDVAWDDGATVAVRLTGTVAEDDATSAPELSVADAQVQEAAGAELAFRVTLSAAQAEAVSVRYVTADGTAKSGSDYVAVQGAVRFAPGETSKTVAVAVLDDAHDDGSETMTLALSAPFGAELADGEATGTIVNSDPVPKAWLARFGRTVAGHVVDAIGERFEGSHGGGSHLTLGGERVSLGAGAVPPGGELPGGHDEAAAREGLSALADRIAGDAWTAREAGGSNEDGTRTMTERELLLGSSFRLTLGGDGEGAGAADTRWTAWGRAAASRFDGKADGLTLDGDVTTFTLGADAAWSRWLAGMAVSLSEGEGAFRDHAATGDAAHEHRGTGTLESSLTSVHPYLRYQASERLSVWGVLGAGSGDLTLELDEGERWTTDTAMEMAAAGMRGVLVPARETGGFELAARSDAQFVRMRSDAATGSDDGDLRASDTDTTRVRVMLEGSRAFALDGGGALAPTFEAGLRHDGGDAETGAGIELGGGLRYTVPAAGLTAEAKVRGLVAHQDADYSEWGASGSVRLEPHASGRGLSLTLAPLWGADSGGAERLWSAADARGLGRADDVSAPGGRLDAEVGYGFTVLGGRAVATPHAAWSRSKGSETLRLGQRLKLGGSQWHLESEVAEDARTLRAGYGLRLGASGDLGLEASRRDAADGNAEGDGYELMLRARLRW